MITHNKEKTKNQYNEQYNIILIQYYISKIIGNIYAKNVDDLNNHKFNKKNKNNYLVKHNQTIMINGLKIIMPNIINANLTKELLFKL